MRLIYCHRALGFFHPDKPDGSDKAIAISPKPIPQEIPDWCVETETYKLALSAHYLEEVELPADKLGEIAALAKILRPQHVEPLACETATIRHRSGIGGAMV